MGFMRLGNIRKMASCMMDYLLRTAQNFITKSQFCGIQWRVDQHGKAKWSGALGQRDIRSGAVLENDTIYRIYSMTKPLVSVLALKLIEEGKIRFDTPLAEIDPRFSKMRVLDHHGHVTPASGLITIEQLLTHRAGFSYDFTIGCPIAPYYREQSIMENGTRDLTDWAGVLSDIPLSYDPGTSWKYSVATDVLAHALECVTGGRIDKLLIDNIFKPLGMTDTSFYVLENAQNRVMSIYGQRSLSGLPVLSKMPHDLTRTADLGRSYPLDNPNFRRGGSGLYSTVADYMNFANMLRRGTSQSGEVILSPMMLSMLRAARVSFSQNTFRINDQAFAGYGWGLSGRVMENIGAALYTSTSGEFGWGGAAATYFWVDPLNDVTGCVMTQYIGSEHPLGPDMQTAAMRMLASAG